MPFIDVARRRRQVAGIVGMACVWPSLHNLLCYPLTYSFHQASAGLVYEGYLVYATAMLLACAALWMLPEGALRRLFSNPSAICAFAAAGTAGIMLIIANGRGPLPAGAYPAGIVLSALFVPASFTFWSIQLLNASEKRAAFDLLCSYILFCLVTGLRIGLHLQSAAFALAAPALSGALACYVLRFPQKQHPTAHARLSSDFPFAYLVAATLFTYLGSFGAWMLNPVQALDGYPPWQRVAMYAFLAAIMVGTASLFRPKAKLRNHAFPIIAVGFTGILGCTMLVSALAVELEYDVGNYPTIAGVLVMQVGIWVLVLVHAQVKRLGIVRVALAYLVFVVGANHFGSATLLYLAHGSAIDRTDMPILAISAVLACVVLLAVNISLAITLSRKRPEAKREQEAPCMEAINTALDDEKALARMRDAFRLSKRETDTLRLAMTGMSARQMAESLFVAESTVNSHLKSIYRKTDIHSKKDLVKLVERYRHGDTAELK